MRPFSFWVTVASVALGACSSDDKSEQTGEALDGGTAGTGGDGGQSAAGGSETGGQSGASTGGTSETTGGQAGASTGGQSSGGTGTGGTSTGGSATGAGGTGGGVTTGGSGGASSGACTQADSAGFFPDCSACLVANNCDSIDTGSGARSACGCASNGDCPCGFSCGSYELSPGSGIFVSDICVR